MGGPQVDAAEGWRAATALVLEPELQSEQKHLLASQRAQTVAEEVDDAMNQVASAGKERTSIAKEALVVVRRAVYAVVEWQAVEL